MLSFSAACERNKEPILEVLRGCFAGRTQVLEIGSGTGQHAVYFARALSYLTWQPTEQPQYLADLQARTSLEGSANLLQPLPLNVDQEMWPVSSVDAVFTANTLHIMSWNQVIAFFRGVGTALSSGGVLGVYGPFRYAGRYTSDSNSEFDRMLQDRDPKSGLRDMLAITELAAQCGLELEADHDLPANNRLLVFAKATA
jgi:cyclopropane fatty-acyl-phospholipid synthase-like methyltransferase